MIPVVINPKDDQPITPAHFIIGEPLTALPERDWALNDPKHLQRFQRVTAMKQHFWIKWAKEYLVTLQQKYKWRQSGDQPKLDDIVLLVEPQKPSQQWQLGRITALHPGADGQIRVVEVKTKSGTYKRSVQQVCPLPVSLD